jgi:hypothetical protein
MAQVIDRRAALGALVALPALGLPALAVAEAADTLSSLITAHRSAWVAFSAAGDELEAAEPDSEARMDGLVGHEYKLGVGKDRIVEQIGEHCESVAGMIRKLAQSSPAIGEELVTAIERDRDAALARLDIVFAPEIAARERYDEVSDAENEALMAICKYRCASPDELARKFRFLKEYECDLLPEQYDAIFDSFLPETHFDGA